MSDVSAFGYQIWEMQVNYTYRAARGNKLTCRYQGNENCGVLGWWVRLAGIQRRRSVQRMFLIDSFENNRYYE